MSQGKTMVLLTLALALGLAACGAMNSTAGRPILTIAAASDLNPAFAELGKRFEQNRAVTVTISFGSTGNLSKQIENGAPFDIFAAANATFIERLTQNGLILPDTQQVYAEGRLALWQRADAASPVHTLKDLARPEIRRIAIANPQHAPYGQAAEQALRASGLWELLKEKIVFGDNVSQTLQFAETGNVEVAIIALSISQRPGGRFVPVDPASHAPLIQKLGVVTHSKMKASAREFIAFLSGPEGRTVMQKYGFILPDKTREQRSAP